MTPSSTGNHLHWTVLAWALCAAACDGKSSGETDLDVDVGSSDVGDGTTGPPDGTANGDDESEDTGGGSGGVDADGDGYTVEAGDCDDADPEVNPGATDDAWDDRDCIAGIERSSLDAIIAADPTTTLLGIGLDSLGDLDGDGADELYAGARFGSSESVLIWSGADLSDGARLGTGDAIGRVDAPSEWFRARVGGDPMGLGHRALVAQMRPPGRTVDHVYLLDPVAIITGEPVDFSVLPMVDGDGTTDGAGHGQGLAADIDVDGDGIDDVLVGAPFQRSDAGPEVGRLDVHLGDGLRVAPRRAASDADVMVYGASAGSGGFGDFVARAGDVDGDGVDDVLTGATYLDDPRTGDAHAGAGYLFSGADLAAGAYDRATEAEVTVLGVEGDSITMLMGMAGGVLGDLTGDGAAEIYFASPGVLNAVGAVWIFDGGSLGPGVWTAADAMHSVHGAFDTDYLGLFMETGFDFDQDGIDDAMFVGRSRGADHYLVSGATLTTGGTTLLGTDPVLGMWGTSSTEFTTHGDAVYADIDADGTGELVLSAAVDTTGGAETGAIYAIHTPRP